MNRGRELLVGAVIIAAVAVGVVGTLWLQGTNWGKPTEPVVVLLSDVAQLSPGNSVKFRGVQIGQVGSIEVEPDGQAVRVTLDLRDQIAMPPDAGVLLAPESFFGSWQAEIVRKTRYPGFDFFQVPADQARQGVLGGYALPELSRLTASAEEISANLAELSGRLEIAFNDETAAKMSQAISDIAAISGELREFVTTQSEVAGNLTASADSALTEIEAASRVARSSFERIDGLMADAQLDSIVTNVRMATASIQRISANLSGSSEGLSSTLTRADSVFSRIDRMSARIESGEGALGKLVADSTLAVRAGDVLKQLDLLLQDLRENPRRYVRLSIF